MIFLTIPPALRHLVFERAQGRGEYCLVHQNASIFSHVGDHIITLKYGGQMCRSLIYASTPGVSI